MPLKPFNHVSPGEQSYLDLEVVRAADRTEDVRIETADISNKFKFFETYKPAAGEKKQFRITPPRDGVVKLPSPDRDDDDDSGDDEGDEDDDADYERTAAEAAHADGRSGGARNGADGAAANGGDGAAEQPNGRLPRSNSGGDRSQVVRANSSRRQKQRDPIMLQNSSTTTKMLSMFRQLEEGRNEQQHYDGEGGRDELAFNLYIGEYIRMVIIEDLC